VVFPLGLFAISEGDPEAFMLVYRIIGLFGDFFSRLQNQGIWMTLESNLKNLNYK
jgi:hypothetical protein